MQLYVDIFFCIKVLEQVISSWAFFNKYTTVLPNLFAKFSIEIFSSQLFKVIFVSTINFLKFLRNFFATFTFFFFLFHLVQLPCYFRRTIGLTLFSTVKEFIVLFQNSTGSRFTVSHALGQHPTALSLFKKFLSQRKSRYAACFINCCAVLSVELLFSV